jgi:hypothetical protein
MTQVIGTIVGVIALFIGLSLLFALPTMWLWDWLMPELFNLKEITLVQAWGLNVLSGLLFKSHTTNKS